MGLADYAFLLQQARDLGAVSTVLVGEGEPLSFAGTHDVLRLSASLGLHPVLFTNGLLLDRELAQTLWITGASVIVKLNSLQATTHDALVGLPGAQARVLTALSLLIDLGFRDCEPTRLGVETVIVKDNMGSIEALWSFCRDNHIFPYFETMKRCGRAADCQGMVVPSPCLKTLFSRLQTLDRDRFALDWAAHPPYAGFSCQQHYYSCFVSARGDVMPCSGLPVIVGNIRNEALADILRKPVFAKLRDLHTHLYGKCGSCGHATECYGCRANAFATEGDMFGDDPDCWIEI